MHLFHVIRRDAPSFNPLQIFHPHFSKSSSPSLAGLRPFQLIKFTQKKCSNSDPKIKSANARSCEMLAKSALFSGFVWMRREAVRTNWPTVALKPERKALNGKLPTKTT